MKHRIVFRADAERSFLAYRLGGELVPYGFFPAGAALGTDTIKSAPDSCMGCRYTSDTRQVKMRFPSFRALSLTRPTGRDGSPRWRDDSACQLPGEMLIHYVD